MMRELDGRRMPRRVTGKEALTRRLRGLLIAVNRFARCRAQTAADIEWAAGMLAALQAALDVTRTLDVRQSARPSATPAMPGTEREG